ncbi:hypothetical protein CDAR_377801 [Caerostris darwini]|uniref:Uncharacterized protein n=1 Tax=Caerostris darwini TaxID=1538125 RepID=A0AAV4TV58_9ARAC|nr:hypothetical protein CDAR_377801 [Caerostris darwini]
MGETSSPCCGFASGDSLFCLGTNTKEMLSSGLGDIFSWDSSSVSRVGRYKVVQGILRSATEFLCSNSIPHSLRRIPRKVRWQERRSSYITEFWNGKAAHPRQVTPALTPEWSHSFWMDAVGWGASGMVGRHASGEKSFGHFPSRTGLGAEMAPKSSSSRDLPICGRR